MGTWGARNFNNDGSLDYLGGLIDQLTDAVIGCFKEKRADLDDGGESELMPSVAIIKVLVEQCGAAPPKSEVIEEWHSKYVAIYDNQIDGLDPDPDYKVERRNVIDNTFKNLHELAVKFWKD